MKNPFARKPKVNFDMEFRHKIKCLENDMTTIKTNLTSIIKEMQKLNDKIDQLRRGR